MSALNAALTFAEVHQISVTVTQDLDLDVARGRDVSLEENTIVAESGECLTARRRNGLIEVGRREHDAHSLATATSGGFHQQRISDLGGTFRTVG